MDTVVKNETLRETNWSQIFSLAGLNAAVVISWIAYHNFQPQVLKGFGFQELSLFLVIAQAIILTIIPPIAGWLGDYMIRTNGKRFVVFTVGTGATAMIFMAVASMLKIGPSDAVKTALPLMIVLWLVSMNIFHSPANSMLDHFAPSKDLPLVMAVITMITELIYALEPIVIDLVNWLGGTETFITGGVLLIVTGYFFLKSTKGMEIKAGQRDQENIDRNNNFLMIVLIGLTFGMITAFIMEIFPDLLKTKLPDYSTMAFGGNHFSSIILAIAAILAIPLSSLVNRLSVIKGLTIGLMMAAICIVGILLVQSQVLIIFLVFMLSVGFGMASVSAFPYTLQNLNPRNLTFGAGIFFGAVELASGVFAILKELGYSFL
ncbi:MAG: MFS transporter [Cytophagaceae bacterium]|jgi:MFS family permease|nr:MFS transporter [Cytophagaceae bacterium]